MPRLTIRRPDEVLIPLIKDKSSAELRADFEQLIRDADGGVGELRLSSADRVRSLRVRLSQAARRLGTSLEIWESDGRLYFRRELKRRRRRLT